MIFFLCCAKAKADNGALMICVLNFKLFNILGSFMRFSLKVPPAFDISLGKILVQFPIDFIFLAKLNSDEEKQENIFALVSAAAAATMRISNLSHNPHNPTSQMDRNTMQLMHLYNIAAQSRSERENFVI